MGGQRVAVPVPGVPESAQISAKILFLKFLSKKGWDFLRFIFIKSVDLQQEPYEVGRW